MGKAKIWHLLFGLVILPYMFVFEYFAEFFQSTPYSLSSHGTIYASLYIGTAMILFSCVTPVKILPWRWSVIGVGISIVLPIFIAMIATMQIIATCIYIPVASAIGGVTVLYQIKKQERKLSASKSNNNPGPRASDANSVVIAQDDM